MPKEIAMVTTFLTGMIFGMLAGVLVWPAAQSLSVDAIDGSTVTPSSRRASIYLLSSAEMVREPAKPKLSLVSTTPRRTTAKSARSVRLAAR